MVEHSCAINREMLALYRDLFTRLLCLMEESDVYAVAIHKAFKKVTGKSYDASKDSIFQWECIRRSHENKLSRQLQQNFEIRNAKYSPQYLKHEAMLEEQRQIQQIHFLIKRINDAINLLLMSYDYHAAFVSTI